MNNQLLLFPDLYQIPKDVDYPGERLWEKLRRWNRETGKQLFDPI
jgi:hypothetical protein